MPTYASITEPATVDMPTVMSDQDIVREWTDAMTLWNDTCDQGRQDMQGVVVPIPGYRSGLCQWRRIADLLQEHLETAEVLLRRNGHGLSADILHDLPGWVTHWDEEATWIPSA